MNWSTVRKWAGLVVTMPLSIICGFDLAFTVYAVPLRQTFNYTQTQVEVIASAGIIGFGFSILQPSLVKLCGVTLTYVVAGSSGSIGLVLLWVACLKRDVFKHAFLAVTVFQLLACSGIAIAAALTASISVTHFHLSSSAKIVAVYAAMYALGKVFFVYLYEGAFESDDNLGGFFMASAICFVALLALCACLHAPKPSPKDEQKGLLEARANDFGEKNEHTIYPLSHIIDTLRKNSLFHLTFWPAALIYSCTVVIMNNLTTIVPPEHTKPSTIVTVFSCSNAAIRVAIGALMDSSAFHSVHRRLYLKLGVSLFFVVTMAAYLIWIDSNDISLLFAVGSGASVGALFVIPVAMVTFIFGKAFYSFTFGLLLSTAAVSVLLIQVLVGILYDECYSGYLRLQVSDNCFFWPFALIIGVAVLIISAIVGNICYQVRLKKPVVENVELEVKDSESKTAENGR